MHKGTFAPINKGYNSTFKHNVLSIGLVIPLEHYPTSPVPTLEHQLERIKLAEMLGFSAVWLRDVPFNVPSFGDAGQLYDPFVYLGYLTAHTKTITLGVGSIILPLRHPADVAKAAASADVLSGGRLILGVASGDRPSEYPAMHLPYEERGARFRESYAYMRQMSQTNPSFANIYGSLKGDMDMLPKPTAHKLPLLITGASRQDANWIASHGDGWITYPRTIPTQARIIEEWRTRSQNACEPLKPAMQPLYIDLSDNPDEKASPIHLGIRTGTKHLVTHLKELESIGINHIALNLRFNKLPIEETLKRLADEILPHFKN